MQPIQRPPSSISKYFPTKDLIPKILKSNVVYKIDCANCDSSYIGKTTRQAFRRFQEHGASIQKSITIESEQSNTHYNSSKLRRSERN